jgi:protein-tyrosine kinase
MRKNKKRLNNLVMHTDPHSPVAEAYRTLRTNIQFASLDKPAKTVLITGANPACGKSTTVANLGVSLAHTGTPVLLVDTDLRRPTLHKFFGLSNDRGLTNLLMNLDLELEKVVQRTNVHNLYIMTSGPIPPNPAELLATNKMKHVVALFKEKFEQVVFDSPPVIAVTDAAILSRMVDATIMVLNHGVVNYDEAAYAIEQLQKVKANIIGTIINGMPSNKGSYYYYYYYYGTGRRTDRKHRKWSAGGANLDVRG